MATLESRRILKAEAVRDAGSKIAFNYEDIQQRCDDYLVEVRRQAREAIEQAKAESAAIRERAAAEGKQAGHQQGLAQAENEIRELAEKRAEQIIAEKLQTALPALQSAVEAVHHERERWIANWESLAVRLSVAVAEKIIRHQVEIRPELTPGMLAEALELAAGSQRIKIRLHPLDLAQLGEHAEGAAEQMTSCGETEIVADENISRGGCFIETSDGTIDARLETRLDRITAELLHNPHADD